MGPLLPLIGVGLTAGGLGYALRGSQKKDEEADEAKRQLSLMDQAAKDAALARTESRQDLLAQQQQYYDSAERMNQSQIEAFKWSNPDWRTQFQLANQNYDKTREDALEDFRLKQKQRNHELDMEAINQQMGRTHNTFDKNNEGMWGTVQTYLGSAPWRV